MPNLKWFQVEKNDFMSRIMLTKDTNQHFGKKNLSMDYQTYLLTKLVKYLLMKMLSSHNILTYENIIIIIPKEGLKLCIDMKITIQVNKDKLKNC